MSAAASTEPPGALSEVVAAAARGELPAWSRAGERRREHIERVAALMAAWADELALPSSERARWLAAARLHDALREAPAAELRPRVPPEFADVPAPLLHGPAAAAMLASDADPELLDAIRFHTIGHPSLGRLGRALYLADFLEPGRDFRVDWRASLCARVPAEMDEVLREVLASRIQHLLEERKPIRAETTAFWSALVGKDG